MLKRRRRIIALLLLLPMSVVIVLFGELPGDTLLWAELQNSAHIPLFGLVALATLGVLRAFVPVVRDKPLVGYVFAGVVSLMLGVLTEYGQLLTHRDPSFSDVMRDLLGIIVSLGICAGLDPRMQPFWRSYRSGLRTVTVVLFCSLLAVSLFPLVRLAAAYLQRSAAFPVVVDFRSEWSRPFLKCKSGALAEVTGGVAAGISLPDGAATRVDLNPTRYSGVYVTEPYPDWRTYAYLTFVVHSAQPQPFSLVLRIHDALHDQAYSDRFNRRLEIRPGDNRFRIPLQAVKNAPRQREMDMSRIRGIALFSMDLMGPVSFYLDTLVLD